MSDMIKNGVWTKLKREHGLYRYNPSGQYFARVRFRGKLYRRKLETGDLALAKRKLRDFKDKLERTDATKGNASFAKVLDDYVATLTGADSTKEDKLAIVEKLKSTWFGIDSLPLRAVKLSQVTTWMSKHYGCKSASYYNSALTVIRTALDKAVQDKIITENPASGLTYRKRNKPIRLTPTYEQFNQIVTDIRSQKFNHEAEQSGGLYRVHGIGRTRTG